MQSCHGMKEPGTQRGTQRGTWRSSCRNEPFAGKIHHSSTFNPTGPPPCLNSVRLQGSRPEDLGQEEQPESDGATIYGQHHTIMVVSSRPHESSHHKVSVLPR